ncbi:MAG: hypothetical protein ACNI3A_17100 [Desulfovibrio sp.]
MDVLIIPQKVAGLLLSVVNGLLGGALDPILESPEKRQRPGLL